jgi:hypothetical protein
MKYNGYGNITKVYSNFWINYIKTVFLTNIRLAYWTPKKAILYSTRLQQGEKFLLQNKLLYPYDYSPSSLEEANKPLNLSISLENSLFEADLILNYSSSSKAIILKNKTTDFIISNIIEKANTLSKIVNAEDEKVLDLPVAVYARLIYAKTAGVLGKFNLNVSNEAYEKSLRLFLKKLKFADSTSLSMVIFSLAHEGIKDSSTWTLLFEKLENTLFESQFTPVQNSSPHLFKYRELNSLEKTQNTDFALMIISRGLEKAIHNNILGADEAFKKMEKRFIQN